MHSPSAGIRRGPRERAEAWLVMGPLGHLWSVLTDLAAFALGRLVGRRDWGQPD